MTTLDATEARTRLHSLIDEAAQTHRPIMITGEHGNAVLLAEDDWNAINETPYPVSIPGMRESTREGSAPMDPPRADSSRKRAARRRPLNRRSTVDPWPESE